jgi:hypothetical protein
VMIVMRELLNIEYRRPPLKILASAFSAYPNRAFMFSNAGQVNLRDEVQVWTSRFFNCWGPLAFT